MTTTQTTRVPQDLIEVNHATQAELRKAVIAVEADFKAGLVPSPNFPEYDKAADQTQRSFVTIARWAALYVALTGHLPETGVQVFDPNGSLILVGSTVTDGGGLREVRIEFTDDGKPMDATWHKGEEQGDTVRYVAVVFTETGTAMGVRHGFIDSKSRRITQVG